MFFFDRVMLAMGNVCRLLSVHYLCRAGPVPNWVDALDRHDKDTGVLLAEGKVEGYSGILRRNLVNLDAMAVLRLLA